jgi:hypothetical protein
MAFYITEAIHQIQRPARKIAVMGGTRMMRN